MKNRYDLKDFYEQLTTNTKKLEDKAVFSDFFYKSVYGGKNKFYQREQTEAAKFDDKWIKAIESYFPSINRITINLRSTLKMQSEIIPIEKTKKVSKDSIIHLMSHSNFIKEVTDDNVVPKQILTSRPEIEYGIYENRFIMTLINRLRDFIGQRVKLMREKIKAQKVIHLNLNSQFKFEESDLKVDVDVKQTHEVQKRGVDEHNQNVLERAEKLLKLINRLHGTQFMQMLRRFKSVSSPIMKTQVILSNPDFKNAYLLWLYLDRYTELGYDFSVNRVNKRFSQEYTKQLNQAIMFVCSALLANDKNIGEKYAQSKYTKPIYKEKPAKTMLKLPSEVDIEPVKFQLEEMNINEYYLTKNKQILKQRYNNLLSEGNSQKVALKKALADTLHITNSLYESFFEINSDEDIFFQLIKEDDPEKMYKEAYDKYIIACSAREVKEQDFKKAIALEKKWQKELIKYHKILLKENKIKTQKEKTDIMEELKKKYKRKLDIISAKDYREKQLLMRKHRMKVELFRKKLNQEYRDKKKKLTLDTQKRITAERERLRNQYNQRKLKSEEKNKETLKKLRAEHSEKIKKMQEDYRQKLSLFKVRLKKQTDESIQKQKQRAKALEEQRNKKSNQTITERKETYKKLENQKKEQLASQLKQVSMK